MSKPDKSLQIKWFRQGLQHRVHDATWYDEHNADWSSFSHFQGAVLRADARIHSHTCHYRETEHVRSERRTTPGTAPRSGMEVTQSGFRGGRRGGPATYNTEYSTTNHGYHAGAATHFDKWPYIALATVSHVLSAPHT